MSYQDQALNHVEQDRTGAGDELPTYDDLAANNGPNSRFGRWQGWIEKRAAERYHNVTPEERERRRQRGWGNDQDPAYQAQQQVLTPPVPPPPLPPRNIAVSAPMIVREPPTPQPTLQIRTVDLTRQESLAEAPPQTPQMPVLPFLPQRLKPTHLKMFNFGSRFLPHSTAPIRCLLPILSDRLILIGHDEGLSVLDMYPQSWDSAGHIVQRGPDEAQARTIWTGEGVFQMTVLEAENTGDGRPQGVVLALVGPTTTHNNSEAVRCLRMYNLSSLISLAKWAVANKGSKPLELARPSHWSAQSTPTKKRHRPTSSIAKSIRNLIEQPKQEHAEPSSSSYHNLLSPTASRSSPNPLTGGRDGRSSPSPSLGSLREAVEAIDGQGRSPDDPQPHSPSRGDSWDVVDELPLRWATDFVPLASPGSRLLHASILSYALWKDEARKGTGGQLLAVSTKSNILLYETPRGERAFHFVKEFYTPLTPKSITFFQQAVHEMYRSSSDSSRHHKHGRSNSGSSMHVTSESPRAAHTIDYGIHTSLFVVFEKKAGWIRLADSAVGEWDLWDDHSAGSSLHSNPSVASTASRRSRASVEYTSHHPKWIPPTRVHLELGEGRTQDLYLLTRGLVSHLLPYPLPTHSIPPLHVVGWQSPPVSVLVRLCGMSEYDEGDEPFLQVIASGDDGVEVREVPLATLMTQGKGKGRARPVEERYAMEDLGGGAALMCRGGHWDNPERAYYSSTLAQGYMGAMSPPGLPGRPSPAGGLRYSASVSSTSTYGSVDTEVMMRDLKREEGVYGVCRKGLEDWRVFWVGGSAMYEDDDDEPLDGDL